MTYDPNDYGPGKSVTGDQTVEFMRNNYHKIIIMLMLRQGLTETVIDEADIERLRDLPEGTGLASQSVARGIRLLLVKS